MKSGIYNRKERISMKQKKPSDAEETRKNYSKEAYGQ